MTVPRPLVLGIAAALILPLGAPSSATADRGASSTSASRAAKGAKASQVAKVAMGSAHVRFATFNASLNRGTEGELVADLADRGDEQAANVAETIQRVRPDVVLINEFDFDAGRTALREFRANYLAVAHNGAQPIRYRYAYTAPVNTGVPSGLDLDNDGTVGGPNDAYGFGFFPGQYGMVVLSKYPIDRSTVRTFRLFRWRDMPGALLPDDPSTPAPADWYSPAELADFRLSSKSHWDLPVRIGRKVVHFLVSHPTPPVFDGPEDRNGRRNHDEIRFWADYITPNAGRYIYDDEGQRGGLEPGSLFVIAGDENADPNDGDSTGDPIDLLLGNPLVNTRVTPTSAGAVEQARLQGGVNLEHVTPARFDTADFSEPPGNLPTDYVLPRVNLKIGRAHVFWPLESDPLFRLVGTYPFPTSDHRLVWADLRIPGAGRPQHGRGPRLRYLGEDVLPTGTTYAGTEVGGLSGITYDRRRNVFYSLSDDRSEIDPARFYTLRLHLTSGRLRDGGVDLRDVTTLRRPDGTTFPPLSLDPEGIALTRDRRLVITSEGDTSRLVDPFVRTFSLGGRQLDELPVPTPFLPNADGTRGVRNNAAFESATVTRDGGTFFTATEDALVQDGPTATVEAGSPSRILRYNLRRQEVNGEYVYVTDPIAAPPVPANQFATNGLVELLALNKRHLLALERSFSVGVGNTIRLYGITLQRATDVQDLDSLAGHLDDIRPVRKRLLLDFSTLGIPLDNIEGMTFGPRLRDGRRSLVFVSDNNFSTEQFTQVLLFELARGHRHCGRH